MRLGCSDQPPPQLSLFVAAASSYRQDSTLRPFPPSHLLASGERDTAGLQDALASLPSLRAVRASLHSATPSLPSAPLRLLLWVLEDSGLTLRSLSQARAQGVLGLAGDSSRHPRPQAVLEVRRGQMEGFM